MIVKRRNILIAVALCSIFISLDKAFSGCTVTWSGTDPGPTPNTLVSYICDSYQEGDTELFHDIMSGDMDLFSDILQVEADSITRDDNLFSDISQNGSDISANTGQITANANQIIANVGEITSNSTDVALALTNTVANKALAVN